MATYFRPNLTADQRDALLALTRTVLLTLTVDSPDFADTYRLFLKLQECKPIGTDAKLAP